MHEDLLVATFGDLANLAQEYGIFISRSKLLRVIGEKTLKKTKVFVLWKLSLRKLDLLSEN